MNSNKKSNNNKIYDKIVTSITPTPPPAATNNNKIIRSNGTQACAACKYQRRKCAPDCILAPYFPHHRQHQFLNAHKLFGVSNITKIIRYLGHHDKDQAMRTIIYQSDIRANDPVGGCYRIIRDLQRQIEYNRAELQLVLHQLAYCRAQNHQHNNNDDHVNLLFSSNGGLFDMITTNHDDDNIQQYYDHHQIQRPDDQDLQEQYILHGDDCDQQVQFEEINLWEATESSARLEVLEKSCDDAENWQEEDNINVKLLSSDDPREGFKFQAEEKSFDSVNNSNLKTPPPAI